MRKQGTQKRKYQVSTVQYISNIEKTGNTEEEIPGSHDTIYNMTGNTEEEIPFSHGTIYNRTGNTEEEIPGSHDTIYI